MSTSGDRYAIRIGGDAAGPVVAGHDIHVEVRQPAAVTQDGAVGVSGTSSDPTTKQVNTARDRASAFTVMNGEMHIHHDGGPAVPPE